MRGGWGLFFWPGGFRPAGEAFVGRRGLFFGGGADIYGTSNPKIFGGAPPPARRKPPADEKPPRHRKAPAEEKPPAIEKPPAVEKHPPAVEKPPPTTVESAPPKKPHPRQNTLAVERASPTRNSYLSYPEKTLSPIPAAESTNKITVPENTIYIYIIYIYIYNIGPYIQMLSYVEFM